MLDFFDSKGFKGFLAVVFLIIMAIAIPEARGWVSDWRQQNQIEREYGDATYRQLYDEKKAELNDCEADNQYLASINADLRTEIRIERRADDLSLVAKWTLNSDLELNRFNERFSLMVLRAMDVNPYQARGKRWAELFPKEVADKANITDEYVKRTKKPISYDDGFSIERREDGVYKVFWYVIKEPLIDDDGSFYGIRGTASPYRSEKIDS